MGCGASSNPGNIENRAYAIPKRVKTNYVPFHRIVIDCSLTLESLENATVPGPLLDETWHCRKCGLFAADHPSVEERALKLALKAKEATEATTPAEPAPKAEQKINPDIPIGRTVYLGAHGGRLNNLQCKNKQGEVGCVNRNRGQWEALTFRHLEDDEYLIISQRFGNHLSCDPHGRVTFANKNEGLWERWLIEVHGDDFFFVSRHTNKVLQCNPNHKVGCDSANRDRWEAWKVYEDSSPAPEQKEAAPELVTESMKELAKKHALEVEEELRKAAAEKESMEEKEKEKEKEEVPAQSTSAKSPIKRTRTALPGKKKLTDIVLSSLTEEHLVFFNKYGFLLIRGLHTEEEIKTAHTGAQEMLQQHESAVGKKTVFGGLPEGKRPTWAKCQNQKMIDFFNVEPNLAMLKELIGSFKLNTSFDGAFTFAPRFFKGNQNPTYNVDQSQVRTIPPYDPDNLPESMPEFTKTFLKDAASLGARFAECNVPDWHHDGMTMDLTYVMNVLWASYLVDLPEGQMGNLHVMPGSHQVSAELLKKKGMTWHGPDAQSKTPNLKRQGLCDGIRGMVQLCVQKGDVLIAHPLLAHTVGQNTSNVNRLAIYARLSSNNMYWPPETCIKRQIAGSDLGRNPGMNNPKNKKWTGDWRVLYPGMKKWLTNNQDKADQYDNGTLSKYINSV